MEENILSEYEERPIERNKYYFPVVLLICIFICFAGLDMIIDFDRFTWKRFDFDWFTFIIIILIPGICLTFTLRKNKIGWFLSTLFFSFIWFAAIFTIFQETIQNKNPFQEFPLKLRQIIILSITTLICILFQTKSFRVWFRITKLLWVSAIACAFFLALALVMFG